MKATQQLMNEHNGILIILQVFDTILNNINHSGIYEKQDLVDILDFLKIFADKCHHGKEEGILFPKMNQLGFPSNGGPIAVMLAEHTQGRNFIKNIGSALEKLNASNKDGIDELIKNGNGYIQLLRSHISKENNILFPMADDVLTDPDQDQLYNAFEKMEIESIGEGVHEKYHSLIHILKDKYKV